MTNRLACRLLLAGTTLAAPFGAAQAQTTTPNGTAAGVTITNTASATYTVNGNSNTVSSNEATFVVDRKVNLIVERDQTGTTQVNAGDIGAVTRFKVTNKTNGTQDFRVYARQTTEFPLSVLLGTENFDMTSLKVVVDDGDGTYEPNEDTALYIDELAPDATRVVYLVGNVPSAAGQIQAFVGLEAAVAAGGAANTQGALLVRTDLNLLNQENEIDTVFADDDNDGAGPDLITNGRGWAYAAYEMGATSLAVVFNKSATVLSDGENTLAPKAVPGAIVQYCLTVANNTLLTAATNVSLTDVIPTGTTYVPNSIRVGGLGADGVCLLNGVTVADNGSTTGLYGGSFNSTTKTVTATIPLLAGGTSVAASFQVKIN